MFKSPFESQHYFLFWVKEDVFLDFVLNEKNVIVFDIYFISVCFKRTTGNRKLQWHQLIVIIKAESRKVNEARVCDEN